MCVCQLAVGKLGWECKSTFLCHYSIPAYPPALHPPPPPYSGDTQREGMGLLHYHAIPFFHDLAHDSVLFTFSNRSGPDRRKWCGSLGQTSWTGHHIHSHTLPCHSPPAQRGWIYKEATLRFGRRRLLIFEVFLGLHRKSEGEEGDTEAVPY